MKVKETCTLTSYMWNSIILLKNSRISEKAMNFYLTGIFKACKDCVVWKDPRSMRNVFAVHQPSTVVKGSNKHGHHLILEENNNHA